MAVNSQHHQIKGIAHLLGVGEVESHAAEVGLVNDVRRRNFEHQWVTDALGDVNRFIGRPGQVAVEDIEIIGPQDLLRFHFAQLELVGAQVHLDDAIHAAAVDREAGDDAGRAPPPGVVVAHRPQRAHRAIGRRVIGDAQLHEFFLRQLHVVAAHERGEHRFFAMMCRTELLRQFQWRGHVLRGDHDHDGVDVVVSLCQLETLEIPVGFRIAQHIDRIGERGRRREEFLQFGLGGSARRDHFQAAHFGAIGRHDAWSAGVGDDRDTVPQGQRLTGERQRVVEQGLEILSANDAGAPERGPVGDVGPGETAGVGRGGLRARRGDADLEDDDRLDGRGFFGDPQETVALGDAFQVAGDHGGVLVLSQRLEEIRLVQIGLVADAEDLAHAQLLFAGPVQNGHAERAGLGDERNPPARRERRGEGGIHVVVRVEHAQAVRPHEPHPQ